MRFSNHTRLFIFLSLLVSVSLACSAVSIPSLPSFPTFAPQPADVGTPTGSSPMSGDWGAPTDFGKFSFRVSPDGTSVETMYVKIDNWTCGGDTLTTSMQVSHDPAPSLDNGSFDMTVNLGDAGTYNNQLDISGTYNKSQNKFSGSWEQNAYGTTCSGKWETPVRK